MQANSIVNLDLAPRNLVAVQDDAGFYREFKVVDKGHAQIAPFLDVTEAPRDLKFCPNGSLTGTYVSALGDYQSAAFLPYILLFEIRSFLLISVS